MSIRCSSIYEARIVIVSVFMCSILPRMRYMQTRNITTEMTSLSVVAARKNFGIAAGLSLDNIRQMMI